jgi:mRNA-degrading endonuclease RelE of RelBE toxin-antitoxin system
VRTEPGRRYEIRFQAATRRAIAPQLPQAVAAAALEFCAAAVAENPHRAGEPLFGPLAGCYAARRGTYRIVYQIDEDSRVVRVLDIGRRPEIYRPRSGDASPQEASFIMPNTCPDRPGQDRSRGCLQVRCYEKAC